MKKNRELIVVILSTLFVLAAAIGATVLLLKLDERMAYGAISLTVVILGAAIIAFYDNKARQHRNYIDVTQKPMVKEENGVKLVIVDEERAGD